MRLASKRGGVSEPEGYGPKETLRNLGSEPALGAAPGLGRRRPPDGDGHLPETAQSPGAGCGYTMDTPLG